MISCKIKRDVCPVREKMFAFKALAKAGQELRRELVARLVPFGYCYRISKVEN